FGQRHARWKRSAGSADSDGCNAASGGPTEDKRPAISIEPNGLEPKTTGRQKAFGVYHAAFDRPEPVKASRTDPAQSSSLGSSPRTTRRTTSPEKPRASRKRACLARSCGVSPGAPKRLCQ